MITISDLVNRKLLNPPSFIGKPSYVVKMGSHAYGVNEDDSDLDIYAFSVPDKEILFPERFADVIHGFDSDYQKFEVHQHHHILDGDRNYDVTIYSIVRYFYLCMNCNLNMIDSLFVDDEDIIEIDEIGQLLRNNRKLFLSKLCYHRYAGMSYSQFEKAKNKNAQPSRQHLVDKYGYDTKFAYHTYRCLSQATEILKSGNLTLKDKVRSAHMKNIRNGHYKFGDIEEWFSGSILDLKEVYEKSTLQHSVDKKAIKNLLKQCIELKYPGVFNEKIQRVRVRKKY